LYNQPRGAMLDTLLDGVVVLREYKEEIALLLVTAFGLGWLVIRNFVILQKDKLVYFLFSLGIGFLILVGITFFLSIISYFAPVIFRPISFLVVVFSIIFISKDALKYKFELKKILFLLLILISLLALHLPLLNNIILPAYSDSPIHYQIIVQILNPSEEINTRLSIGNIFVNYYHFGFHSLTAWLSSITGIDPAKAISLIGQISLVLASISIATFTFILTKNKLGAISAGLLSVFGWSMPAFAVNWGKFPALLSIALVPIVLGYAISILEVKNKKTLLLFFFLLIGIVVIHTRAIVVIVLALGSLYFSRLLKYKEKLDFLFSIKVSILFIILLLPLKEYILTYYERYPVVILLVILLPFAFFNYSKETTWIFFFISSLWATQFISNLFFASFEFLDIQYISMMLFIPFSILGGLGIAGIIKQTPLFLHPLIFIVFAFTVTYNSPWLLATHPDPCCEYYTQDDNNAFEWINENAPKDSLFIIATFSDGKQQFGSDAGIWITPLTKLNTNKMRYNLNWNDYKIFPQGCNPNLSEVYIYTGGIDYSFSNKELLSINWFELVYSSNSTSIYKISKCLSN
jgi:hypothetical protein